MIYEWKNPIERDRSGRSQTNGQCEPYGSPRLATFGEGNRSITNLISVRQCL